MFFFKRKKFYLILSIFLVMIGIYFFSLPEILFHKPYSTVVFDTKGNLIGARVSNEGKWHFPPDSTVPFKIAKCIVEFEDKYFYQHPGFNPASLYQAAITNVKQRKIIRGGSTLSMQVIRLSRHGKSRTFYEKFIELVLSTRLELRYSKKEILALYTNYAPYGGNVEGINAASWKYFGRCADNLSWAEAALIAVLPNAPSLLNLSKNREKLLKKRNKLLFTLLQKKIIDKETYELSITEPLPEKPVELPDIAPHLTERLILNAQKGKKCITTIDSKIQQNTSRIVSDYFQQLEINKIYNAAALVIEVNTGKVIAYVGNIPTDRIVTNEYFVDMIQARRSTGSILKPFLYALCQQDGIILPTTLIADLPIREAGFKPENYDRSYDGAVHANRALSRSLNIPAIRLLSNYGVGRFQNQLTNGGISTLKFSPDHYGLTLIVGGGEGKLFEIAGLYASMARTLNYFCENSAYKPDLFHNPILLQNEKFEVKQQMLNAGAIWITFNALLDVNRPDDESGRMKYSGAEKIAWKTGTSYGFRDGWAIGTTPSYVVGVWAGNADGEGRPGLTGIGAAAPLMFKIFSILPKFSWFQTPYDDLNQESICRLSGYKAGENCETTDTIWTCNSANKTPLCPYHVLVHLDKSQKFRVNSKCYAPHQMVHKSWFVLPPAMEWFYKRKNAFYRPLPPFGKSCIDDEKIQMIDLIYPNEDLKIYIPIDVDGKPGQTIFEATHRNTNATLFWHIDNSFITETQTIHQVSIRPEQGSHILTIVDNMGNTFSRKFEVISKK